MTSRKVYDAERCAHFVTCSCFHRRKLLDADPIKLLIISELKASLSTNAGHCLGYVVMPSHVHAIVWLPESSKVSKFMNRWKSGSSHHVKHWLQQHRPKYVDQTTPNDAVWQAGFYDFNLESQEKIEEKLDYMHLNPVRAKLVERAVDWPWSSARWYIEGRSVGVDISWPE